MRATLPALALLFLTTAATAAPDPALRELIRDAKASKPVAFERTQRVDDNGKATTYIDRYDPALTNPWKLVSVDGRAPKAQEIEDWKKSVKNGVPGYARVQTLLAAAHRVDATHYHLDRLPKGFLPRDMLAEHLVADLTIDASGARPFVREARFYATAPFRMFIVAKIDKFDATNRYAEGPDGAPRIVAQDTLIAGSGPGMSGTQAKHATFAPLGH